MRRLAVLLVLGTIGLAGARPALAWDNFSQMQVVGPRRDQLKLAVKDTMRNQAVSSHRIALADVQLFTFSNGALK
jgi:hypothetical protein